MLVDKIATLRPTYAALDTAHSAADLIDNIQEVGNDRSTVD